jgi:hypothetical protein
MSQEVMPMSPQQRPGEKQKRTRKRHHSDYDRIAKAYKSKYGKDLTPTQIARISKQVDGTRRGAEEVLEAIERAPDDLGKKPWQWVLQRLYGWSLWPEEVKELRLLLRGQDGTAQEVAEPDASDEKRIAKAYKSKYGMKLTPTEITSLLRETDGSQRSAGEVVEAIENAPQELGKRPWQWIMQRLYGWSLWPDEVRELRALLEERGRGRPRADRRAASKE